MDSRGKGISTLNYIELMSWIEIINDDLPRMRLYAAATLGSATDGDAAVESALRTLLDTSGSFLPDREMLFCLLDWQARNKAVHSANDRIELLKHVCGFTPEASAAIVQWDALETATFRG